MGGTFKEIVFSDRDSDYPSRRKLIKISEQENIYDVSRAEGTVRNEGTPFNAKTLNDFQDNISSMFPVTVTNGGTGATTAQQARTNLGIPITYGTFNSSNFGIYADSNKVPLKSGSISGKWYRISNFVHCDIVVLSAIANTVPNQTSNLKLGPLPYNNPDIPVSVTVGGFTISSLTGINIKSKINANSNAISTFSGDGYTYYNISNWASNSYKRTLSATLSVSYIIN